MVNVQLAEVYGLCRGAADSIESAKQLAAAHRKAGQRVVSFGDVLNNSEIIGDLNSNGVESLNVGSYKPDKYNPADVQAAILAVNPGDVVCITAHGIEEEVIQALKDRVGKKGMVYDLTCRNGVVGAQRIAANYRKKGYGIVLVATQSDMYHPEVRGILSHAGRNPYDSFLVTGLEDIGTSDFLGFLGYQTPEHRRYGVSVLAKTTVSEKYFEEVSAAVKTLAGSLSIPFYSSNTVCQATRKRQDAMRKLAAEVGAVVVVTDDKSSNGRKLCEIARAVNPDIPVYPVLGWQQLAESGALEELKKAGTVGVSAAASAFPPSVDAVVEGLKGLH